MGVEVVMVGVGGLISFSLYALLVKGTSFSRLFLLEPLGEEQESYQPLSSQYDLGQ